MSQITISSYDNVILSSGGAWGGSEGRIRELSGNGSEGED